MNIKGLHKEYIDVEIDNLQAIDNIILDLFKHQYQDITILDNCLYYQRDVSYHGSPVYNNILISNEPYWVEIFNNLNNIRQMLLLQSGEDKKPLIKSTN